MCDCGCESRAPLRNEKAILAIAQKRYNERSKIKNERKKEGNIIEILISGRSTSICIWDAIRRLCVGAISHLCMNTSLTSAPSSAVFVFHFLLNFRLRAYIKCVCNKTDKYMRRRIMQEMYGKREREIVGRYLLNEK